MFSCAGRVGAVPSSTPLARRPRVCVRRAREPGTRNGRCFIGRPPQPRARGFGSLAVRSFPRTFHPRAHEPDSRGVVLGAVPNEARCGTGEG